MTDSPTVPPEDGGRSQGLGATLRAARQRKGLELSDIAEVTHVRKEYLSALEEGRYSDLPEDVYARNFLRLYAQAVSLDGAKMLEMFTRERSGGRAGWPQTGSPQTGSPQNASAKPPAGAGTRSGSEAARGIWGSGAATPASGASDADGPAFTGTSSRAGSTGPTGGDRRSPASLPGDTGGRSLRLPSVRLGSLVATVLLVGAVVAVALWAFNNQLFNAGRSATPPAATSNGNGIALPPATPGDATGEGVAEGTPAATEQARDVLLTVVSEPSGAEVTVDGFAVSGATPVEDVPVTARASRVVRVSLDGYEPFEATYDLSFDRTISVILEPAVQAAPAAAAPTPAAAANGPPQIAGQGQIALTVTEATWLEVYASTARQQGERLVYTTAQPGDRFMFQLPVYVHVGNAAGVHVSVDGQDFGVFGSSGAVMGRAFTQ